jgi:hypothetical protein
MKVFWTQAQERLRALLKTQQIGIANHQNGRVCGQEQMKKRLMGWIQPKFGLGHDI